MTESGLTLEVRVDGSSPTTVTVKVLDAPGPSGYQVRPYKSEQLQQAGDVTVTPLDIDAVALQSRATLLDFLRDIAAPGATVDVICLEQRVPTLRRLLGAKPGETVIRVDIDGDGNG